MKSIGTYVSQFLQTLVAIPEAIEFSRKNKLWVGFWKYGWVAKLLIGLGILVGIQFVSCVWENLEQWSSDQDHNAVMKFGTLTSNVLEESYNFLFTGGLKYVMLLLMEVVIFHMCRRTLEILTGETGELTVKTFVKAQIRMIKIAAVCFGLEIACGVCIKIAFNLVPAFDFLEPTVKLLVHTYFIGFLILDNYHEQFDLKIKASVKYGYGFIGVGLACGLLLNAAMLVPIAGPILGPMLAAIVVTLVMFRLSDLHTRVDLEEVLTPQSPEVV